MFGCLCVVNCALTCCVGSETVWWCVCVPGMLRVGERRLVMLTMLQMEGRLANGDDSSLNAQVCLAILFSVAHNFL